MDIFSHALWGATIVRKKTLVLWALLAAVAPDILGSGPGFLYLLFVRHCFWSSSTWGLLEPWMKDCYHFWHSLLGALVFFVLLLFLKRQYRILILPFLSHVFIDLFTHAGDVLHRLFFPLVSYDVSRLSGLNWWEHWWILAINVLLLIFINVLICACSSNG